MTSPDFNQPLLDQRLIAKIVDRQPGICVYGFAPPRSTTPADQLTLIASQQLQRLSRLELDGVIVYDIQDETERTSEPRPFPFLPTLEPEVYAHGYLAALGIPKVIYRSVTRHTPQNFVDWLTGARAKGAIFVLVGAPSRSAATGLALRDAYGLFQRHAPELMLGGVTIAERHEQSRSEHQRMLVKMASGCRFFVTQAVYDVTSTLSLLSDYALAANAAGIPPAPILITFSPCGSLKNLAFMKWLGVKFPIWLENELRYASDPLDTSLMLCRRIFMELWDYASSKGIPLGVNVESVSIRKTEIEASLELSRSLKDIVDRSAVPL